MTDRETEISIQSLIPTGLGTELELKSFRNIPHLQKVAGLVFLLLSVKKQYWEETYEELEQIRRLEFARLAEEGRPHETLGDLIQGSTEYVSRWVELRNRDSKEIPEIVAKKLKSLDNPLGLDMELTRAVLEMANDYFETQLANDAIDTGAYDPDWNPDPVEYLEGIIIDMFEFDSLGFYGDRIFPPDVAREVRLLIQKRREEIRSKITENE